MNAAEQELVRTTFSKLAVMPEVAGALFYERLFALNPTFRPLFKERHAHSRRQANDNAHHDRLQLA